MKNANHYAYRLKTENAELRAEVAALRNVIAEKNHPEIPVYGTLCRSSESGGHGCLNFADRGGERNRSRSGCFSVAEIIAEANRAPVFDITELSISQLLSVSDLPLSERVAALDALFVPRLECFARIAVRS
jgi:hypothetical protein